MQRASRWRRRGVLAPARRIALVAFALVAITMRLCPQCSTRMPGA